MKWQRRQMLEVALAAFLHAVRRFEASSRWALTLGLFRFVRSVLSIAVALPASTWARGIGHGDAMKRVLDESTSELINCVVLLANSCLARWLKDACTSFAPSSFWARRISRSHPCRCRPAAQASFKRRRHVRRTTLLDTFPSFRSKKRSR